jgi:hypothetical protein
MVGKSPNPVPPVTISRETFKIVAPGPVLMGMALVTGRFLSPESAALLDTLIEDSFAESEEVCEVETVARGRAFGRQLTTAQRKAIEDRAVKAATEHFETEGWFVDDVGLYEQLTSTGSSVGQRRSSSTRLAVQEPPQALVTFLEWAG